MNEYKKVNEKLHEWGIRADKNLSSVEPPVCHFRPQVSAASRKKSVDMGWWRKGIGFATLMVLLGFLVWNQKPSEDSKQAFSEFSQVYSELIRMFPDQSVWLSGLDSDVEMGMQELDTSNSHNKLVLRVVIQEQGKGDRWENVWRRDIVTSLAAWVDTESSKEAPEKLSVWTQSPSEGIVVLESYLDLPQPYAVTTREQVVLTLSETGAAMSETFIRPGVRMIQTLMEIDSGGNGV